MPHKKQDDKIFSLYGTNQQKMQYHAQVPSDDISIKIHALLIFLLLVSAVIVYETQQRFLYQLENERLRLSIIEKQKQIDAMPTREQLANEILQGMKEKAAVGSETAEKPKPVKRKRQRRISLAGEVITDGYGERKN